MNLDRMDRVLAAKREIHPELSRELSWDDILRILEREGVKLYQARLPNPAKLVPYDSSWGIVLARGSNPKNHKHHVAHELAHLWLHVDEGVGRFERCLNYTSPQSMDPLERDADYMALAILFGPKVSPRARVPAHFKQLHADRYQPVYLKAGGTFLVKAVGTSFYQKPFEKICGPRRPEGYDRKTGAILKCEDENPHDPNAVRVEIGNFRVGYLSRENAKRYRAKYGNREIRCPAWITGGNDHGGGDVAYFGVRLDLSLEP